MSRSRTRKQTKSPQIQPRADINADIDYERISKHILNYFTANGFNHVSFEAIRQYVNSSYDDRTLFETIDGFPDKFRRYTLKGNKSAVGLV